MGLAVVGAAAGHTLAYLLSYRDGADRATHAAATGHGSWSWAALRDTVLALGVVGAVTARVVSGAPISDDHG